MIVVPISGGKDSQACLKLAKLTGDTVVGMFCDTKFEHPLTYSHIDRIERLYDVEIYRINEGSSVIDEILTPKNGELFFPGMRHRFCTRELKIRPSKRFYQRTLAEYGPFEVWIGVRKDESAARRRRYAGVIGSEILPPHEFMSEYPKSLAKCGVMFRLPIIDWSELDVFEFLNGEENSLYSHGFNRVGCFPCLAAGDKQMTTAFNHDQFGRDQWRRVQFLQDKIGKSVFRSDIESNGCSICSI